MEKAMRNLLAGIALLIATSASAWEVEDMNEAINQTNFIVGMNGKGFCSGTLISLEHRLVLNPVESEVIHLAL